MLMAEHSMCQPGRPSPQGDGHDGSPSFLACQRTKSMGSRFSGSAGKFPRSLASSSCAT